MSYSVRHLPHWQPDGAAIFVTWRLYGSLPKALDLEDGLDADSAFHAVDSMLARGATGPRWLDQEPIAKSVVDAIHYGQSQLALYALGCWVVMPNHVHILLYPNARLSRITKAIKNFSARQCNAILERTGQPFWQDESFDHWVRTPGEAAKIIRYIENNPVAARLVERPDQWRWSSAYLPPGA
jgi:type I restriction enzyme R subunit/putative DNA methylase